MQIVAGAIIVVVTCEICKLPEYLEIKSIIFSKLKKNKEVKNI
jgi:hypothetical protein